MSKGPGKGKKFCPACKAVCGAVSKKCPECKNEFYSKEDKENTQRKVKLVPDEYVVYRIRSTIYVPAGYCPFKLKAKAIEEDVSSWAHNVRLHFLNKSQEWLLNHALCYYVRYDFDPPDKEYDRLCKIINELPDIKEVTLSVVNHEG